METTPDTNAYMIGGFVVFTVVMVAYVWSLYSRWRALENEQRMLDELK